MPLGQVIEFKKIRRGFYLGNMIHNHLGEGESARDVVSVLTSRSRSSLRTH